MGHGTRYSSHETPYEPAYPSYDEDFAEPVDLDAFDPRLRPPHPARSIARRDEFLPDESVPLFLSGFEDERRLPKFGRSRNERSSRLLKSAAFAIAATVAAFVAMKNPFTVFASATASLVGASDIRPSAAPPAPPARQAASVVSNLAAMAATNPTQAPSTQAPSRDEIALALKAAHQNQAALEVPPPLAATAIATVTPVVRRLATDELATLMTRGRALLDSGDIPPARLLLERAAEAGEASAALMLAQTYDPSVLGSLDIRNITGDPAMARKWYQRAAQLGSADAQRRLSQLQ